MTNPDEFQKDREVIAAATEGPWEHWWCGDDHCDCHAVLIPDCPCGIDAHKIERSSLSHKYDAHLWTGSDGDAWSNASNTAEFIARARTRWPIALDALDAANQRIAELGEVIRANSMQSDDQGFFCAFCEAHTEGFGDALFHDSDCIVLTIPKEATDD